MKRSLSILSLGLAAAVGSHLLWFQMRAPDSPVNNPKDLSWLQQELHLSESQFERIRELHSKASPRIAELALQIAQMHEELEAFENTRRTTGQIDFLEFAHFVELRRAIDAEYQNSTRQLVQESAGTMSPEQKEQYLRMIATGVPSSPLSAN